MPDEMVAYLATKQGGRVKRFTQPTGHCAGHVAVWMRRRMGRKEFFDTAKGFSRETLNLMGSVSVDNFVLPKPETAQAKRFTQADRLMKSQTASVDRYNREPKHEGLEIELMVLEAIGESEAARISEIKQQLQVPQSDPEQWLTDYATKEKPAHKRLSNVQEVPAHKGRLDSHEGLVALLQQTPANISFVSLGGSFGLTGHAIGFDNWSENGRTVWFDPNLGEIDLPTQEFEPLFKVGWVNGLFGDYEGYGKFKARVFEVFEARTGL